MEANNILSLIDKLIDARDNFKLDVMKYNDLILTVDRLEKDNEELRKKCALLEKETIQHKEEVESLRRVSIIKNMSKQVHELKSQNEILTRKVNHYKSIADVKTDSSILSASQFDGIDNNEQSIEIDTESNEEVYNITESLARLLNIPIETKLTSKSAVHKVLTYIEDNNIFDSKNNILKNDYKLYYFLNLDSQLNKDETSSILKNLCKIVKNYGLTQEDSSFNTVDSKSKKSVKKTIEDYLPKNDNKSSSDVNTVSKTQETDVNSDSESDEEEEELEVKKIGKRYYYVSIGTNIVYKAVKQKNGDYEVGKRLGILSDNKIMKD